MGKALPKQVQDQIDEADRIAAEIEAAQVGDNPELTVVENEPPTDVPLDAGLSLEAEQPQAGEIDTTNLNTPEPEPLAELAPDENFEHKYKTLQGMYNSEKRLNDSLQGRVDSLENILAGLQAAREVPAPEPSAASAEVIADSLLTEQEITDYGPDMIDVVKRAAREAVSGELATLREENAQLKAVVGNVGNQQELDVRGRLYANLTTAVPNWKQVNKHPDFLDWLSQVDVYAGVPRNQMLSRAFETNDTERVIQFFKGFLSENAALQPAANAEAPDVTPDIEPAGQPRVTLESLASPGLGHGGGADNISETGRMWKESEIGAFYEDARKGKFKGRQDDYKATENEIQAALTEGRILVGQ